MIYTIVSPLGPRLGPSTFDTIFNTDKYSTHEEAFLAHDFVKIDFVKDADGIIYFELSHSKRPDVKVHQRLLIQHFPFGIDMRDDHSAIAIAVKMMEEF